MRGKFEIEVYNNRVHYFLTVKRNITVIQGNSATGKTELVRMIADYAELGSSSGITLLCEKRCVVVGNSFWKESLHALTDSIVFIDEGAAFLKSKDFADCVKNSENYFVLVTRESLEQLPYSIEEIYGLRENTKYKNAKRIYNEMYQLYFSGEKDSFSPELIITEDSNSGYEFFSKMLSPKCESAFGKSKVLSLLQKAENRKILAIVDGAAFGSEIARVMRYMRDAEKEITLYAPESFEWLLLKADLVDHTSSVTEKTYDLVDGKEYFSWEEYFTAVLIEKTQGTIYQYSKRHLKEAYLTTGSGKKIMAQLPEQIQSLLA